MTEESQFQEELNDQMIVRRQKMEQLQKEGIDPFGHRFERTHNSAELHELFNQRSKEELKEILEMVLFEKETRKQTSTLVLEKERKGM